MTSLLLHPLELLGGYLYLNLPTTGSERLLEHDGARPVCERTQRLVDQRSDGLRIADGALSREWIAVRDTEHIEQQDVTTAPPVKHDIVGGPKLLPQKALPFLGSPVVSHGRNSSESDIHRWAA